MRVLLRNLEVMVRKISRLRSVKILWRPSSLALNRKIKITAFLLQKFLIWFSLTRWVLTYRCIFRNIYNYQIERTTSWRQFGNFYAAVDVQYLWGVSTTSSRFVKRAIIEDDCSRSNNGESVTSCWIYIRNSSLIGWRVVTRPSSAWVNWQHTNIHVHNILRPMYMHTH